MKEALISESKAKILQDLWRMLYMIAAPNLLKKGKAYELENIFLKCKTKLIVITHKMQ
jgi:hypothetical protein